MRKIVYLGAAFVIALLGLYWVFPDFVPEIVRSIFDGKWWAASVLNWVVFGVAVAIFTQLPDWLNTWRYRGYSLVTFHGKDALRKSYPLTPSDAKDILTGSYAGWQLIKSIASTSGVVNEPYYEEAVRSGLLILPDNKGREIRLFLEKLGRRAAALETADLTVREPADPALRA